MSRPLGGSWGQRGVRESLPAPELAASVHGFCAPGTRMGEGGSPGEGHRGPFWKGLGCPGGRPTLDPGPLPSAL